MTSIEKKIFDKYSFLKVCEYCRILEKIYYTQAVTRLKENYRLFNKEESLEGYSDEYRKRLEQSIENTIYILRGLNIQPFNIVLTRRASVQLEYEIFNSYLEIEVFSGEINCLVLFDRYNYSTFQKINLSIFESYKLLDLIDKFFYRKYI